MQPQDLSINDFDYTLPEKKIALFPLQERDQSRLLIYKNEAISEDIFRNIADHLPEKSFLIFNDTKVINARILFTKPTGGVIEIFLLEPCEEVNDYSVVLQQQNSVRWKCMIGGAGKWKQKSLEQAFAIGSNSILLKATLVEKLTDAYVAELSWSPGHYPFAEVLEYAGKTPLPPYIKRDAEESDVRRYQTIYSRFEGSVAAPTAGLHFTERIFSDLKQKQIETGFVTLHVGAGTFKPVKSETMAGHEMHAEWMDVSKDFIGQLLKNLDNTIICVGTTAVRTIESLYWMGVKTIQSRNVSFQDLEIHQWEVYGNLEKAHIDVKRSLQSLLRFLEDKKLKRLFLRTQIIIAPGYEFKIINGIVTNFHQPKSTLLLLVAAIAGNDWRKIYDYALYHDFRFLSYGDGCLIFSLT
ncbi:MAG TPA: S-adenosylmethionine:tRNA ribosyltransferase-isomerase [Chitinophagaceae bacterium]|nr:S-adenosylmethionine:tRNA ribosyltransferase-isomerase [Chitinophagaceae bacterium]